MLFCYMPYLSHPPITFSRSSQYSRQHPILKHPHVFSCPLSDHTEKRPAPRIFFNMVYENFRFKTDHIKKDK
jgi:hypothetical protein